MQIRAARVSDVPEINKLINFYAEHSKMLFRSKADIYEKLQSFIVAEDAGQLTGCCALQVVWSDLAEIKSLAVRQESLGRGIGRLLVQKAAESAAVMGISRIFALTLEPEFFSRLGFSLVEKDSLPMKVWSDCARCPKQDSCDEIAVIKNIVLI